MGEKHWSEYTYKLAPSTKLFYEAARRPGDPEWRVMDDNGMHPGLEPVFGWWVWAIVAVVVVVALALAWWG